MDKIKYYMLPFFLLSCTSKFYHTNSNSAGNKKNIVLIIKKNWNLDSLNNAQINLSKQNITFNYSDVKFEGNNLTNIAIKVNCNDGYGGAAESTDLDMKFGFFRNYDRDSKYQFSIGTIGKRYHVKR
ncbi:hypothetical protein Q73A0000_05785 [Kaistella flava (ex Peng et al. 2021)]|uniref:Lipoprotein n=1 Tax=Kaistella flava (ex Peng et al. 2021) TaxID=2038776 RepID=A0A7M2Y8A5_9FLAO|nr:hypothetical protein [Kaistella flava (ex Peng et al. 2021)]QOW09904.1 hypothetical protein Q73A0000_05785 [Kaistella flava (ex Peng et al. 2021)]